MSRLDALFDGGQAQLDLVVFRTHAAGQLEIALGAFDPAENFGPSFGVARAAVVGSHAFAGGRRSVSIAAARMTKGETADAWTAHRPTPKPRGAARRVVRGHVQRLEIVVLGLDLGPLFEREAAAPEKILNLTPHPRERMQMPAAASRPRKADVDPVL